MDARWCIAKKIKSYILIFRSFIIYIHTSNSIILGVRETQQEECYEYSLQHLLSYWMKHV